jgi:hypothetical protein
MIRLRTLGVNILNLCALILGKKCPEVRESIVSFLQKVLGECREGSYQVTETLIRSVSNAIVRVSFIYSFSISFSEQVLLIQRDANAMDDVFLEMLFELLDSKGNSQKKGAEYAFEILRDQLDEKKVCEQLMKRVAMGKPSLKEAAMILIKYGKEEELKEKILELCQEIQDPAKAKDSPFVSGHLKSIAEVIVLLGFIGKEE